MVKKRVPPFDIEEPAATIGAAASFHIMAPLAEFERASISYRSKKLTRPVEETDLLMSSPAMVVLSGSRMEEAPL